MSKTEPRVIYEEEALYGYDPTVVYEAGEPSAHNPMSVMGPAMDVAPESLRGDSAARAAASGTTEAESSDSAAETAAEGNAAQEPASTPAGKGTRSNTKGK